MIRKGALLGFAIAVLAAASAQAAPQAELVKEIRPGANGSGPDSFARLGDRLYFAANDGSTGMELWATDGSAAGTQLVKDIDPDNDGYPYWLTPFDGRLYFQAFQAASGNELWSSDGTTAGTQLVEDIASGPADHSSPEAFAVFDSTLFFAASTLASGYELWKAQGPGGADPVATVFPGPTSASPSGLTPFGGRLYFAASSGLFDNEPWSTDGTEDGTDRLADVNPGSLGSAPTGFTELDGWLYFQANDGGTSFELWRTNGTTTALVEDINPIDSSYPEPFKRFGGKLYFPATDNVNGRELWVTDGTAEGTELVKNIASGADGSYPSGFTVFGGRLYFQAEDAANGLELWSTDGTTAGTQLVKDINPGTASSYPGGSTTLDALDALGGKLYFGATTEASGHELWVSDGTAAGTQQVRDINPGPDGSSPGQLHELNDRLYFNAYDEQRGAELWAVSDPQLYADPPVVRDPAVAPEVSHLRMTNKRFATRKPKQGRPKHPVGTRFQFDLSAAGEVTIAVDRKSRGYRSDKRCVAKRPKGKPNAKRCNLFKRVTTIDAGQTGRQQRGLQGQAAEARRLSRDCDRLGGRPEVEARARQLQDRRTLSQSPGLPLAPQMASR